MANIQHASIPDGQIHEPKGISTATNGQVYVADGSTSGAWQKVNEVDSVDYSDKTKNVFGWNDVSDNAYTSGSPLAITSGTRTLLVNNGLATQSDTSRLGSLWDAVNSKFLINDLNASYILRVNYTATAAAGAGTPYTLLFEMEGGSPVTVFAQTTSFIKGGGYVNKVGITQVFYVGSYINNTDLKLYVTPDTNINLYNIGFVLQRLYKES